MYTDYYAPETLFECTLHAPGTYLVYAPREVCTGGVYFKYGSRACDLEYSPRLLMVRDHIVLKHLGIDLEYSSSLIIVQNHGF